MKSDKNLPLLWKSVYFAYTLKRSASAKQALYFFRWINEFPLSFPLYVKLQSVHQRSLWRVYITIYFYFLIPIAERHRKLLFINLIISRSGFLRSCSCRQKSSVLRSISVVFVVGHTLERWACEWLCGCTAPGAGWSASCSWWRSLWSGHTACRSHGLGSLGYSGPHAVHLRSLFLLAP